MSKSEFIHSLKTARNLFFHPVQTGHPGLDPETVEAQVARAAIWLTPSSVNGFDVRDFPELPSEVRNKLKENVTRFVNLAKQVPSTHPASEEQVQKAMKCLVSILEALESYFPSGSEHRQVRDTLATLTFPDAVLTWDFELGADSTGDPAVWVWIFVDSESAAKETFAQLATDIEQLVREALARAGITRWPYIRFRTASEQRALLD